MSYPDPSTAEVNAMLEALGLLMTRNIRMTGKETRASYQAFKTTGWTDEALFALGHMEVFIPVPAVRPVKPGYRMTAKAAGSSYRAFIQAGWTDDLIIAQGYMELVPVKPDYTKPLPSYISRKRKTPAK